VASPESAQYLISGSNQGTVEGRVTDRVNKTSLLAKAYPGAAPRRAAHALADDIVQLITHIKGIAQTKIAFKVMGGDTSELYVADYDGHNPHCRHLGPLPGGSPILGARTPDALLHFLQAR
jgi:TolB protein